MEILSEIAHHTFNAKSISEDGVSRPLAIDPKVDTTTVSHLHHLILINQSSVFRANMRENKESGNSDLDLRKANQDLSIPFPVTESSRVLSKEPDQLLVAKLVSA